MKKIVSALLSLAMLLSAFCFTANADEKPTFSAEYELDGELATVYINIHNNPGITGLQLSVSYLSEALELLSVEDKSLFGNSITHSPISKNPIKISWYDDNSANRTENGTLAVLKFRMTDSSVPCEISLSYKPENVFNSSFTNVEFETKGCIISRYSIGDTNRDGYLDIRDVTTIQLHLAELKTIPEQFLFLTDTNGDCDISISDATHMQMYLAHFDVVLGKQIQVNT